MGTDEKEIQERELQNNNDGDVFIFTIEHGAFTSIPKHTKHQNAKNWLAKVEKDPASPGGLKRAFATKANGSGFYYLVPKDWQVGDFIECAGDYISWSGKTRYLYRWYGVIVEKTEMYWKAKKVSFEDIGKVVINTNPENPLLEEDEKILRTLCEKYSVEVILKYLQLLLKK